MKQKLELTFLSILCFTLFWAIPIKANEIATDNKQVTYEYFENGDCIETIIETDDIALFTRSSTTSGKKTARYKSSEGAVLWSVTVHGTFSYNGNSSKCTSSTVSSSAPGTSWSIANSSSSKSGNAAIATATAKRKNNGAVVQTVKKSVTLHCSAKGVLS